MKQWSEAYQSKLIMPQNLRTWSLLTRQAGKKIATLNGSFDLLHAGHLQMIYEASQVADVLLVALNSDASIKAYKSSNRPIIPLDYRLQLVSALSFVDYVTWFEETDPRKILSEVQPFVHVNGCEYGENCIEAETVKQNGGHLHLVKLIPGLSTTQIIKKINTLSD